MSLTPEMMPAWELLPIVKEQAARIERLEAAIALVRAETLEEAAQVAEMMGGTVRQGNIAALYIPPTAKDAAAAIRALKDKPSPSEDKS